MSFQGHCLTLAAALLIAVGTVHARPGEVTETPPLTPVVLTATAIAPVPPPLMPVSENSSRSALDLLGTYYGGVEQAGCTNCATPDSRLLGLGTVGGDPGCGNGCGNACQGCRPGKTPCDPCDDPTFAGRFFCVVYQCICCPDPCYQPQWTSLANAAFTVDGARPTTMTRFRWDTGLNVIFPDRAEFFWARADGNGRGPMPTPPFKGEKRLDYTDLRMVTEVSAKMGSFIIDMPYRSIDPTVAGTAAGYGDMALGTKSLLFDTELFQFAFQFMTHIPTGNFTKGVGNGHVSLEPSVIFAIKCSPETFVQGQISEWIPLGGDPDYQGAILHYHLSVNQVLAQPVRNSSLIGTFEMGGWSFQHGKFTDPVLGGLQKASGETYLSMGPGLRMSFCDKIDFGIGSFFALGSNHFARELYRFDFRYRF